MHKNNAVLLSQSSMVTFLYLAILSTLTMQEIPIATELHFHLRMGNRRKYYDRTSTASQGERNHRAGGAAEEFKKSSQ
mgnify:CR=1 FL=1